MRPIDELSPEEARGLRALLFDLDDTVLDAGRLGEAAYSALFRMKESGLALVAVTGRPSGWAEVVARQWPVDGAISENGAIAATVSSGRLEIVDFAGDARPALRGRLERIVADVARRYPALRPSDDVRARLSDFTFDIGEHERVPDGVVKEVRAFAEQLGARTVQSSVHLHLTLDGSDKASGAVRFLAGRLGFDETAARLRAAFIGDSQNDEACFGAFRTAIAVANFRGRPTVAPRFVTRSARGAGFAEAAAVLVERRTRGAEAPSTVANAVP
jgi:HAD superfamily hydrolase (TIGR01484 family)